MGYPEPWYVQGFSLSSIDRVVYQVFPPGAAFLFKIFGDRLIMTKATGNYVTLLLIFLNQIV